MHGQVALLMEPSLKAGHIVRHVGTLSGTPSGGLSGMYSALTAGAAARSSSPHGAWCAGSCLKGRSGRGYSRGWRGSSTAWW